MIFSGRAGSGHFDDTVGAAKIATRFESAARRKGCELRNNARDGDKCVAFERWRCSHQALRVGMLRFREDFMCGAFFDDASGVHDGHAFRYLRYHA
jgi:hypothetical protein